MSAEVFTDELDALLELLDARLRELDRRHEVSTIIRRRAHVAYAGRGAAPDGIECSCAARGGGQVGQFGDIDVANWERP